jgi:hypothetical protein
MIQGFKPAPMSEPVDSGRLQWRPALKAGLIAGGVLLVVPHGSPWSSFTFFVPAILGRNMEQAELPLPVVWGVHLLISVFYGLVIAFGVSLLRQWKAILVGGGAGLLLYLLNLGVVALFWPSLQGGEGGVILAHLVFGLIAGGAYRGLLSRSGNPGASSQ